MNADADRELSRLYRARAHEEPPQWLDQRVLDAANRDAAGVETAAGPRKYVHWHAPLALAAVLVLAVSLSLVVDGELERAPDSDMPPARQALPEPEKVRGTDRPTQDLSAIPGQAPGDEATARTDARVPAAMSAPKLREQPGEAPDFGIQSGMADSANSVSKRLRQEAPAPAEAARPASPLAPIPGGSAGSAPSDSLQPQGDAHAPGATPGEGPAHAPTFLEKRSGRRSELDRPPESTAPGERERRHAEAIVDADRAAAEKAEAARVEPPRAMAPSRQSGVGGDSAVGEASLTPEQWLREIEQLYREGRGSEADDRLEAFRRRFPAYPLPQSLK